MICSALDVKMYDQNDRLPPKAQTRNQRKQKLIPLVVPARLRTRPIRPSGKSGGGSPPRFQGGLKGSCSPAGNVGSNAPR